MTQRRATTPLRQWLVLATVIAISFSLSWTSLSWAQLDDDEDDDSPSCFLDVRYYNNKRRVKTGVNTECGFNGPWGNWGVESAYTRRYDGFQFPGWRTLSGDPWLQWNSCTNAMPEFQPPNWLYYNDANHRRQKGFRDDAYKYALMWRGVGSTAEDLTCQDIATGVFTVRGSYMDLYELDHGIGDDFVTRLRYPDLSARIECQGAFDCSGESPWKNSNSNYKASAKIQIRVDYSQ